MVVWPGVVELLIVAVYVWFEPLRVALTSCPGSLEENWTGSLSIGWPCASLTVAVAVEVENPSATIVLGLTERVIVAGGPTVCVRSAEPLVPEVSLATTVDVPTVVELVKVAVATPSAPVTALPGVIFCPESLEANVTVSPATGRCAP